MSQALPNPELIGQVGVLGYLMVVGFVAGIALMAWMVKRLVDSSIRAQEQSSQAIAKIVEHEATEQLLLDQMSRAVQETMRSSAAHLEIAREWKSEGVRRTDVRRP